MNYRLAQKTDIDRLVSMAESAKAYFRENGIDQWQKGEPNAACMLDAIGRQEIYVLEEDGEVMAMITIVSGPEPSYAAIDGAWLNEEPYCAFHRVCVDSEKKGRGLAAQLFSQAEGTARSLGFSNIRIDTHPDNRSMQRALEKSGFIRCGCLILKDGSEAGDPRFGYQKVLGIFRRPL